ncbi:MAG: glucosaminidase domain-containing protein [Bacteroidales bacterium]|nr:glucosaminidase domain-containing protein [Bacteroidales bacterium]
MRLFIILLVLLSVYSCGVRRPATSVVPASAGGVQGAYIDRYSGLAISEMKRSGVPASITLAQGMLESNYGRSRLAVSANNHFGIKCHSSWKGATITHDDDRRNECFRKYNRVEDSFSDHSDFLTSTARYRELFSLKPEDYAGWARGLKKAGYATNPDYANLLIRKIEEYELWRYDRGYKSSSKEPAIATAPEKTVAVDVAPANVPVTIPDGQFAVASKVSRVKENNRIKYIIADGKDTRESIENEFSLLKWELARYNDAGGDFRPVPGQIVYLQPKRDRAESGKDIHNATGSDTMYSISQQYGIKLKKLYEMNRMAAGEEPREGDRIWLRAIKP